MFWINFSCPPQPDYYAPGGKFEEWLESGLPF
jgi:hypothetical protein